MHGPAYVLLLLFVTTVRAFDRFGVTFGNAKAGQLTHVTFVVEIPKGKVFEVPRWQYLNIEFPAHKFQITQQTTFESTELLGKNAALKRDQMWWDKPNQTLKIAGPLFQRGPDGSSVLSGTLTWTLTAIRLPFSCDNPGTYTISAGASSSSTHLTVTGDPEDDIIQDCNLPPTFEHQEGAINVTEDVAQDIFDGTTSGSMTVTITSNQQATLSSQWWFVGEVGQGTLSIGSSSNLDKVEFDNDKRKITLRGRFSKDGHAPMQAAIRTIKYTPDLDFHATDVFEYTLSKSFSKGVRRPGRLTQTSGSIDIHVQPTIDGPKVMSNDPDIMHTEWQASIPLSWTLTNVDTQEPTPNEVQVSLSVKHGSVVFPVTFGSNTTCAGEGEQAFPRRVQCGAVGDKCNDGNLDTIGDVCVQRPTGVACAGTRPTIAFFSGGSEDQQILDVLAEDSITPEEFFVDDLPNIKDFTKYHIIYLAANADLAMAISDDDYERLYKWVKNGGRLLVTGYGAIADPRMAMLAGSQTSTGVKRGGRKEKSNRQRLAASHVTRLPLESTQLTSGRSRICLDSVAGHGAVAFWALQTPVHQPGQTIVSAYGEGEAAWSYGRVGKGATAYLGNGLQSSGPTANVWTGLHAAAIRNFATDTDDAEYHYTADFLGPWDEMAPILASAIYKPPTDTCYTLLEDVITVTLTNPTNSASTTHTIRYEVTSSGFEESCGTIRVLDRFDFEPHMAPLDEPVRYALKNLVPWHHNDGDSMKAVLSRTRDCWRQDWISTVGTVYAPSYTVVLTSMEEGTFYLCYSRTLEHPQWAPADGVVMVVDGAESTAQSKYYGCRGFINVDDGQCGCTEKAEMTERYNKTDCPSSGWSTESSSVHLSAGTGQDPSPLGESEFYYYGGKVDTSSECATACIAQFPDTIGYVHHAVGCCDGNEWESTCSCAKPGTTLGWTTGGSPLISSGKTRCTSDFYEHNNQYSELRDDATQALLTSGMQGTKEDCGAICQSNSGCNGFTFNRAQSRCWFSTDTTYGGKYSMQPSDAYVWYEKKRSTSAYSASTGQFTCVADDIRGITANINNDDCGDICNKLINCRSYTVNVNGVEGQDAGTCIFSYKDSCPGMGSNADYTLYTTNSR